jgi:hypothetical protein
MQSRLYPCYIGWTKSCRISNVFCWSKLLYRSCWTRHRRQTYYLTWRQPIRAVAYPCILNRQMRAATDCRGQCVCQWFPTSLLKITHCHCLHYCVGNVIMPARSKRSSWHNLSAMYPVVWLSDTIPQVERRGRMVRTSDSQPKSRGFDSRRRHGAVSVSRIP